MSGSYCWKLIARGSDLSSDLRSLGRNLFPEMVHLRLEIKAINHELDQFSCWAPQLWYNHDTPWQKIDFSTEICKEPMALIQVGHIGKWKWLTITIIMANIYWVFTISQAPHSVDYFIDPQSNTYRQGNWGFVNRQGNLAETHSLWWSGNKDEAWATKKANRAACGITCGVCSLQEKRKMNKNSHKMDSSITYVIAKNNTTGPKWSHLNRELSFPLSQKWHLKLVNQEPLIRAI